MSLFKAASEKWNLESLYKDLARSKRKIGAHKRYGLTPLERRRLRGLLLGYSPAQIAAHEVTEVKTVEVALSQGLYRYVEVLTGRDRNSLNNWRDIKSWLTTAGYRYVRVAINCKAMPDVPKLYGRESEFAQLQNWIVKDDTCRLVTINGSAGMGKTSLAITLAKALKNEFDGVIWQSLRHKPPFAVVMNQWLGQLPSQPSSNQPPSNQPPSNQPSSQMPRPQCCQLLNSVMSYLHEHRCLMIIDNLESILMGGSLTASYEPGFEDYAELLKRLSEEPHKSCVIVTSRESNCETKGSAAGHTAIRNLRLKGLSYKAAKHMLIEEKLPVSEGWRILIEQYRGNPFNLRIVASAIQEMFDGDVSRFLKQRVTLFGDIEYLIAQQCDRLSAEEKDILIQLAQKAEPMMLDEFEQPHKFQAILSLKGRSLVEQSEAGFTLRPVVMEYVLRYLI